MSSPLRIIFLIPLIWAGLNCLQAQSVQITFTNYESFNPYSFRANLSGSEAQRVIARGELRDGSGELKALFDIGRILLQPGENTFLSRDVLGRENGATTKLEAGDYVYCILVYLEDANQELGRGCNNISLAEDLATTSWNDRKPKGLPDANGKLSGESRLSWQHSSPNSSYQDFPTSFLRWETNAQFQALGLPISMNSFLSTEQQSGRYDVNSLRFSLDLEAYWQAVREKFLQKLEREKMALVKGIKTPDGLIENLQKIKDENLAKRFPELMKRGLDGKLDSLFSVQKLNKRETEKLGQVLENKVFQKAQNEYQKWQEKYDLNDPEALSRLQDSLENNNPKAARRLKQVLLLEKQYTYMQNRKDSLQQKVRTAEAAYDKFSGYQELASQSPRDMLENPEVLKNLTKSMKGKLSFVESFDRLGLGTVFLNHNPLSLDGLALRGIDVAIQKGALYIANSTGKVQGSTLILDSAIQTGSRWLSEIQLGLGHPEENHAHIHLQQGWGESKNSVWGVSAGLSPRKKGYLIKTHYRKTIYRDSLDSGEALDLSAELKLPFGSSKLRARYIDISDSYSAFGAPLLISGRKRLQLSWEGKLSKELVINTFYRQDEGQTLAGILNNTTQISGQRIQAGARLNYRPQKGPYISASFAPFLMGLKGESEKPFNYILHINSAWQYSLGKKSALSSISTFYQKLIIPEALVPEQTVLQIQANQSLTLSRALGLQLSSSYTEAPLDSLTRQAGWMFRGSVSLQSKKWGSFRLGLFKGAGNLRQPGFGLSGGYEWSLGDHLFGLVEYQYQSPSLYQFTPLIENVLRASTGFRF